MRYQTVNIYFGANFCLFEWCKEFTFFISVNIEMYFHFITSFDCCDGLCLLLSRSFFLASRLRLNMYTNVFAPLASLICMSVFASSNENNHTSLTIRIYLLSMCYCFSSCVTFNQSFRATCRLWLSSVDARVFNGKKKYRRPKTNMWNLTYLSSVNSSLFVHREDMHTDRQKDFKVNWKFNWRSSRKLNSLCL